MFILSLSRFCLTRIKCSDHMWPFSTNVCDERTRYSQEISACNDNPGYGMQPNRGRGASEIGKKKNQQKL
jgi:hypothetical protein